MTNDFDKLLKSVISEARTIGVPVSDKIEPRVKINSRAVRRFGRCVLSNGKYTIELSSMLIDAPERSCRQTIAHEIIHTCPGCMDHGKIFRRYAEMMNNAYGYSVSRTGSREEMGIPDEENYRFAIICQKCGKKILRLRRSSITDDPSRYRCECGGRLRVESLLGEKLPPPPHSERAKYIIQCLSCGRKFERTRISPVIKNPSRYRCSCGGELIVKSLRR